MAYSQIWTNSTPAHPLAVTVSPTAGRVLVMYVITDAADGNTFTFPTGFSTPVTGQSTFDNTDLAVAYKVATGSETSLSVSNTNLRSMIGAVVEFSGINTTTPLDVAIAMASSSSAGTTIDASLTPVTSGVDLLSIVDADTTGSNPTFSWATTVGTTGAWTQRADQTDSSFFNVGCATATQTTAGAITVRGTSSISSGLVHALVALRPTGGGGIAKTAADTNTPTDSSAAITTRVAAAADTATPADSVTAITNRVAAAADTATPTDSAVSATQRIAAAADTNTPTDSSVAATAFAASAADTNTPTDSSVATATLVAVAADTATPTDSAASETQRITAAIDTATPTDSAVSETQRIATAADTNTPSDSAVATIAAAGVATAADTNTPTDSAVAVSSLVAAASDTSAPTDSATAIGSLAASATDVFSATDSAASRTDRVSVAADSNAPSDSAVASVLDAGSVAADSLTLSDSAAALLDARATAADSLLFTDRAVAARPAGPGGGRAWLRAWLQEQYGKDFERYAKERRERELRAIVARTAVVPAATQRQQEAEARGPKPAPMQDRRRELFALIKTAASKPRTTEVALPPMPEVPQIQRLGPAVAAQRAPDLAPDEEAMILEVARLLKL